MKSTFTLFAAGILLAGSTFASDESFEKDRKAILSMAGDFKVGFHFQETVSLHEGYKPEEKAYKEEAFETVKVVEDSGKKIVLQHILQAGPAVVKHWAQIWTYEDTEILEFQGERTWTTKKLSPEEAKGKWSQRVTQVDDSPRYEGIAAWVHGPEISEWTALANRPKPRREEKREDYDLLVVTNRHTITSEGWFHEQDNAKWVKRDGKDYPLVREIGFNPYLRVKDHDFTKANTYWDKTNLFWKDVRQVWEEFYPKDGSVKVLTKAGDGRLMDVVAELVEDTEDGKAPAIDKIRETLKPYVVEAAQQQ
ncbi:DUF6607 family protein [Luteolibacter luteus]|uniref:Outer membrane lipoprotein-sorting protein n=1 Tax=Luteolibacter luteus TaxID=2728835 RepID=A0A858REQ9_9BACT|nr:DUF6607 family protein [Luteolibacter luteus]QJE95317.1 hypothetical protein HHL09_05835 [Luteolibacter luteus]